MAWDAMSVSAMLAALPISIDQAAVQRGLFAHALVYLADSGVQSWLPYVGTRQPIWGARTVDGPCPARCQGSWRLHEPGRWTTSI